MIPPPSPEQRAAALIEALPYIQKYRGHTFVIKYGGSAMEDPAQVERLLRDVVFLEAVGINPVLVHGGGKAITEKMRAAGLTARFVAGLRITDESTISLVEEALDKEINPSLVKTLCLFGGKACGLSGKRVFLARPMEPVPDENGHLVDVGFVGEVSDVDVSEARHLLDAETVPVISPLGADEFGQAYNINADVAAAALAAALQASKLIFVSDVPGILGVPEDQNSLIPTVHVSEIETLISQRVIAGGMIPKVRAAARALEAGAGKIHLISGAVPHGLLLEIFTDSGIGTEILPARAPRQ